MPQYLPQIEILVRDDSENNDTKKIVSEFGKMAPIRYFRGKKEGLDPAIIFLTEEACGLFVWWIGDDIIAPEVIQRIISLIEEHQDLTFIWVNSHDVRNKDALTINDRRSYYFSDKNQILDMDIGLLGFITATIFKRGVAIPGWSRPKNMLDPHLSACISFFMSSLRMARTTSWGPHVSPATRSRLVKSVGMINSRYLE